MINRRFNDRASCPARHSLKQTLERKPRTRLPATWNGGHESGSILTLDTLPRVRSGATTVHLLIPVMSLGHSEIMSLSVPT
jgi:hypothetical protein